MTPSHSTLPSCSNDSAYTNTQALTCNQDHPKTIQYLGQPASRLQDGAAVVEELPPGGALHVVVVPVPAAPLHLGSAPCRDPGRVPGRVPGIPEWVLVVAEVCEVVDVTGRVIIVVGCHVVGVARLRMAMVVAPDEGRNLRVACSLE